MALSKRGGSSYACGSYSKSIGLYDTRDGAIWAILDTGTGVTQVAFGQEDNYLFSGGRRDSQIVCWDIRNTVSAVYSIGRSAQTNQKIYFDVDWSGRYLVTGGQDGVVSLYSKSHISGTVLHHMV